MNHLLNEIKTRIHTINREIEIKDYKDLDTNQDEINVADLLNSYGHGWSTTKAEYGSDFIRWDAEGYLAGQKCYAEVRSRTDVQHDLSKFDTWILDTYKADWMLENFPGSPCFFINVYRGRYEVYDMRRIVFSQVVNKRCKLKDGWQDRELYEFPKDGFIIELATQEKGKHSKDYKLFTDGKQQ